jgi:tRNA1(Val) A37 N6-methylase TrmN6
MAPARFFSSDTFLNGRIRVSQLRSGYRFSVDAVLLADFAQPKPGDTVVDLGTGCGIIPMILAYRRPDLRIWGVEIQERLARVATENVTANRMTDRVTVLHQDMQTLKPAATGGPVNLVVSNPPYRKADSGRINADSCRALARHEIAVTLDGVLAASRRLLPLSGRFAAVYPAGRLTDMISGMRRHGIEPKRLRIVHSSPGTEARLVLVGGVRGGRPGIHIAPPLFVYDDDGEYSAEVAALFEP